MLQGPDGDLIRTAWAAYDLGPIRAAAHHAGTAARTWRITTDSGQYLLRTRGARTSSGELVACDHALRRHLLAAGIPTAAPLPARDGNTCVRVGGKVLEVYPVVPGATLAEAGPPEIAAAARMLARFHAAAAGFAPVRGLPPVAQYRTLGLGETSTRMEDPRLLARVYASLARAPGSAAFPGALAAARRWLERLRREFGDPVYGRLPHTVTHGDFTLANLLFLDGRVSGVFDFDWVRWAPRVRDVADGLFFIAGRRRTPLVPGDIWSLTEAAELSVGRAECWLRSYEAAAPLEPAELRSVPLALAARWLSVRVEGMAKVPEPDRLRFALGNLCEPLDWLDAHWEEVARAVRQQPPAAAAATKEAEP